VRPNDCGEIFSVQSHAAPLAAGIACKVKGEASDKRKLTTIREKLNGNMRRAFVKLRPPISQFSFLLIQAGRARSSLESVVATLSGGGKTRHPETASQTL
jgi:hypothetical protein